MTDEEWELEMLSFAVGSPSAKLVLKDSVEEILALLKDKEKELLILSAAGYDNHEIALHLGYASNKVVATRLAQISEKVRKAFQKRSTSRP
jgi:FixJ family two-component response regulator